MTQSFHDDIEVFADGNMSEVIRRGDSVFRRRAPWSHATHQVLRYLEDQGFPFAPRLERVDQDHEQLSFLPGCSIPADLSGYEDEALVVQLGSIIRRLHDALKGFRLAEGTTHVPMLYSPASPTLICHSDIGPWNTIVVGGEITGLIDWDLVAPGTPEWDLAYAAWRFAPLYPEGRTHFTPAEQARRIVLLLDSYGLPASRRGGFMQLVLQRVRSAVDTVELLGKQRVPGFSTLYDNGLHLSGCDDQEWLVRNLELLSRIVERHATH